MWGQPGAVPSALDFQMAQLQQAQTAALPPEQLQQMQQMQLQQAQLAQMQQMQAMAAMAQQPGLAAAQQQQLLGAMPGLATGVGFPGVAAPLAQPTPDIQQLMMAAQVSGQKRDFEQMSGGGVQSGEQWDRLVAQVKDMQRGNTVARSQWEAYTDQHGGGKRDPSKHDMHFLQSFLVQYSTGAGARGASEGGGDSLHLGEPLKTMQRKSHHFKLAWSNYCLQFGEGKNDPAKHSPAFHVQFLDELAQKALMSMLMGMGDSTVEGGSGLEGPAPKKGKGKGVTDNSPPPAPGDIISVNITKQGRQEHQGVGYLDNGCMVVLNDGAQYLGMVCDCALVVSLKPTKGGTMIFANIGEPGSEQWNKSLNGSAWADDQSWKTPAQNILQGKGTGQVVLPPGMAGAGDWPSIGGAGDWPVPAIADGPAGGGVGAGGSTGGSDPEKDKLVYAVQSYLICGTAQRDTWWAFCDANFSGVRDPSQHTAFVLQQFCHMNSVPVLELDAPAAEPAPQPNLGDMGGAQSWGGGGKGQQSWDNSGKGQQSWGDSGKGQQSWGDSGKGQQSWGDNGKGQQSWGDSGKGQQSWGDSGKGQQSWGASDGWGAGAWAGGGSAEVQQNSWGGADAGMAMGGCAPVAAGLNPDDSMLKDMLVERVKIFQKSGDEQKDAWYSFCGSLRDPSRHDAAKLQEFIQLWGVP